ncbi:MAG: pyridoxal-phosphate dependent enzyme [Chitinophagia bacterium]|nr:pyridoxal-phosphate dependent enzyme [Chitinophagia bacterium]
MIYFKYKILHIKPPIQAIPSFGLFQKVDLLRLDLLHPIVSGNKFYKLRHYIEFALAKGVSTVASFGGPYSNHIVALAYTAKEAGLKSIGYIRTNADEPMTPSLKEAKAYGMELVYSGRTDFQSKKEAILQSSEAMTDCYFIDEGGYGIVGAKGAATILTENNTTQYDYIICAVGTGTMLAGIINAAEPNQKIIGIPVLKNEGSIESEINALLEDKNRPYTLLHQFHQGGYAKTNPMMLDFMNRLWDAEKIPTDVVYTSKLLFGMAQLIKENYFEKNATILVIHSGGLQGNRSLPEGSLKF